MKKSTIVIFIGIGISLLAISFIPGLVKYLVPPIDTSSDEAAEPVYHRVEAERYEICFPELINGESQYGGLSFGSEVYEDIELSNLNIVLTDEVCTVNDVFILNFYVYIAGSGFTNTHEVELGDYGRYIISETQVEDEPVAFTLEPLYEYVLVD